MRHFFNSWVVFTLALFYFGPVPWNQAANPLVAVVVVSCLVAFNIGAIAGGRLPALPSRPFRIIYQSQMRWGIAVAFLIFSAFHTYSTTQRLIFDPSAYSLDFNAVYYGFQEVLRERSTGAIGTLLLLVKATLMPAVFLMIVCAFRDNRVLLVLLLFPFIASSMLRGTDKETLDLALYILVLSFYHKLLGRRFLIAIALIGFVLMLFTMRKLARFEGVELYCLPANLDACFDFNNWISRNISPSLEFLRIMLTNYITQGYEGLGRALGMRFEFTWGLGHIQPIKAQICSILNVACGTETFNDRLPDYGWDTRTRWSSTYTAIANDFHWVLSPLYFLIVGVLFGVSEKSWSQNRDRFSLACLLLIVLFFVYSSANMQLTISVEWSFVYLTLFSIQSVRIMQNRPGVPARNVPHSFGFTVNASRDSLALR